MLKNWRLALLEWRYTVELALLSVVARMLARRPSVVMRMLVRRVASVSAAYCVMLARALTGEGELSLAARRAAFRRVGGLLQRLGLMERP